MSSKKDYQKIFGNNIQQLRNSHNYTVHEFSELLGISEPFLRQIERGEKGMSIYNIITLLNIFNIKFEALMFDDLTKQETDITERLNALNARLNASEKELLASLLKAYLNHTNDKEQ